MIQPTLVAVAALTPPYILCLRRDVVVIPLAVSELVGLATFIHLGMYASLRVQEFSHRESVGVVCASLVLEIIATFGHPAVLLPTEYFIDDDLSPELLRHRRNSLLRFMLLLLIIGVIWWNR